MSVRRSTYNSLIQGVSQQVPQERLDGQLGSQINMISDPNSGLRRRSGTKYEQTIVGISKDNYIDVVEFLGEPYVLAIDTAIGKVTLNSLLGSKTKSWTDTYFKAGSRLSIKQTMVRDNLFIVNTDKVPTKVVDTVNTNKNPYNKGYFAIASSSFSRDFAVTITNPNLTGGGLTVQVRTSDTKADEASPDWVARMLYDAVVASGSANIKATRWQNTVAIEVTDGGDTNISTTNTDTYVKTSGTSRVDSKNNLMGVLPSVLDKYIMGVGTVGNSSYFQFDHSTKTWREVAAYEPSYKITNQPRYIYEDTNEVFQIAELGFVGRLSGDDDNNPLPKFLDYGLTGISAYQSRLVLLSGSYVNFSASNEYHQFSRKTVEELLDDDPIEVANATLGSTEFEYAIPFNKDLVLIARDQQAVIPANSTVLTPRSAVIYPSTEVELSVAAPPVVVERSVYYAYQRGSQYYQVGEFIPNSYTDGQYYSQGLTDHVPMYAQGVCTRMIASSTNNMVVCSSGNNELLVNQFLWSGDDRLQMAFHKWVYPLDVLCTYFNQDYLILILDGGVVVSQNIQINMASDKLAPYSDMYSMVEFSDDDTAVTPEYMLPWVEDAVASTYSEYESRHYKRLLEFTDDLTEMYVEQSSNETIVIGLPYYSELSITPPFVKDARGNVIVGSNDRIRAFNPELAHSGSFDVSVGDVNGQAFGTDDATAQTWTEVDLGQSWVNGIGSVMIPCRTRLSSTYCQLSTSGTYELNIRAMGYQVRISNKHKNLYRG